MDTEKSCALSREVEGMCHVAKGPNHGPAPIPEEGKWVKAKEVTDKENHEAAIKAAAAAAQISSLEKQVTDLLDRLEKVNTENKKAQPKN